MLDISIVGVGDVYKSICGHLVGWCLPQRLLSSHVLETLLGLPRFDQLRPQHTATTRCSVLHGSFCKALRAVPNGQLDFLLHSLYNDRPIPYSTYSRIYCFSLLIRNINFRLSYILILRCFWRRKSPDVLRLGLFQLRQRGVNDLETKTPGFCKVWVSRKY